MLPKKSYFSLRRILIDPIDFQFDLELLMLLMFPLKWFQDDLVFAIGDDDQIGGSKVRDKYLSRGLADRSKSIGDGIVLGNQGSESVIDLGAIGEDGISTRNWIMRGVNELMLGFF